MNPLLQKHKKSIMIGGIAVTCTFLAGLRWYLSYEPSHAGPSVNSEAAAAPSVRAFKCEKVNYVDNLVMTGNLQGGAQVDLRFERDGRVAKVNAGVGGKLAKGQIIAELETEEAHIRLQQAQSELSQAVDLFKAGAIAKPRLTQAQLAAELARKEYNRSFIKAPRDGSIGEMNVQVGDVVNPQVTVATLVSIDNVFVEMGVIEKDLSKLHNGQNVKVEVESYPGTVFQGKITNIAPVVEGTSRTRLVRAEIPNPKGVLLPGMFAKCAVFVMEKPNTLVVPANAIRTVDGKSSVYLIRDNQTIGAASVILGHESADYSEVTAGVEPGQLVVASVSDNLRDGAQVEVIEEIKYESH